MLTAVQTLVFNVMPTFADIGIALVFFVLYFEWTLAVVIFFVMAAYGKQMSLSRLQNSS